MHFKKFFLKIMLSQSRLHSAILAVSLIFPTERMEMGREKKKKKSVWG